MNSGTFSTPLYVKNSNYTNHIDEKDVIACVFCCGIVDPTATLYCLIPLIVGLIPFPKALAITGVRISCFGIRANFKLTASIVLLYALITKSEERMGKCGNSMFYSIRSSFLFADIRFVRKEFHIFRMMV